jgi:hypothetical protein
MTFSTNGYTITGNTLTLSGTTPTITTNSGESVAGVASRSVEPRFGACRRAFEHEHDY